MIIVSGTATVAPGAIEKAKDAIARVIAATRQEDGCLYYSYGVDVMKADTIVILEYWRDNEALQAHFTKPHMAEWMKTLGEVGVISQDVRAFDVAGERRLLG